MAEKELEEDRKLKDAPVDGTGAVGAFFLAVAYCSTFNCKLLRLSFKTWTLIPLFANC